MKQIANTKKTRKRISLRSVSRILIVFLIAIAMLCGIFFSSYSFADKYTLGQDFSSRYEVNVSVYNSKSDPNHNGQPNGDAKRGAEILNERLNPLGMKDIRISQAGANYLQVSAAASSYNNIQNFKNNIQKSGSIILTDANYNDLELTPKEEGEAPDRTPLSDYFTKAKATTRTVGALKNPYISYNLNGDTFSKMVDEKSITDQKDNSKSLPMFIFTDINEFYNDVRYFFNIEDKKKEDDRFKDYFDYILVPLRDQYQKLNSDDNDDQSLAKGMLYDLFYGSYLNDDKNETITGSLMEENFAPSSSWKDLKKFVDNNNFDFTSDTNSYVYNADSDTKSFESGGTYYNPIKIHTDKATVKEYKIYDAFSAINPQILGFIFNEDRPTSIMRYFINSYMLFQGSVVSGQAPSNKNDQTSFFDGGNFYTLVDTQSKAKINASIFNAAGEGFSFVPSAIWETTPPISNNELIIALSIVLIIALALSILMLILYRLLALFTIIIAVTTVMLSLLIMTAFNLPIGLETVLGSVILFGISLEIGNLLFSLIKRNVYNMKRGVKTSFKIAAKDVISFAMDITVVLIITSICLFWLGTNAIKSLAALLSIGSALIILLSVIVGMFWMMLLTNTNIFDKAKWLFVTNIDPNSRFVFQEYKLNYLAGKRNKLIDVNKKTEVIDKKMTVSQTVLDKKRGKQEEKFALRDAKKKVLFKKRTDKIDKKMTALQTVLDKKRVKQEEKFALRDAKKKVLFKKRIDKIDKKMTALQTVLDKKRGKQEEKFALRDAKKKVLFKKRIDKIENKIKLLSSMAENKHTIVAHDEKLKKMNEQLLAVIDKLKTLDETKDVKEIKILKQKIKKLKKLIDIKSIDNTNISVRHKQKIKKLNFKIDDLTYMLSDENDHLKLDDEEQQYSTYSRTERRKIKSNERILKNGGKVMLGLFGLCAIIFSIIFPIFGAKLDESFGGAVIYTVWGENNFKGAENELDEISNSSSNVPAWYRRNASDLRNEINQLNSKNNDSQTGKSENQQAEKVAKDFANFIKDTLTNKSVANSEIFNAGLPKLKVSVSSGIHYMNNNNDPTVGSGMWMSIEANAQDVSVSRKIKSILETIMQINPDQTVEASGGYISKRLHPFTTKKVLKQVGYVGLIAIAILLIYIIIRFKWTYYVALAISTIFALSLTAALIVICRVDIDTSTLTLGVIGFVISLYLGMYTISSIKMVMNRKNEKSLTKFFEKEISSSIEIKKERRRVRELIFKKRSEVMTEIKINKKELSKEEIKKRIDEIKTMKIGAKDELTLFIRQKRDDVRRESRRNNYLYEVVSEIFSGLWKKMVMLLSFAAVITVALVVGFTANWSNSFIFIISFIISSVSCLFILIPMWAVIEQFRIHNRLASKRFINQIVISQEEQLVENIND